MRQGEEGGRGDKAERVNSENSRGTQTRSKECARARDAFFFLTYPFTYPGKGRALFLRLFISNWRRIGFDEETREIERLCTLSKERE